MSDPNQRLIAWQIKTDTGRMKETLDAMRPEMLEHCKTGGSFQNAECRYQRSKCGRFSRWRPCSHFAISPCPFAPRPLGRDLCACASVLLSKWAARGLDPDVLAAIRIDVFDVDAPVGPCP